MLIENEHQLPWISYNKFEDIEEIGKGGFATVYAAWLQSDQNLILQKVALKLFKESGKCCENFIMSFHSAYIEDLGLSTLANLGSNNKIYGIMPYMAPEELFGKKYSMASDVYSFGILAYEIASGFLAFHNVPHDITLAREICHGLRPKIPTHVPKFVAELIIKCWNVKPEERLSSKEIFDIIDAWNNEISNGESTEIVAQIKKADETLEKLLVSNASSSDSIKVHPEAIYTSRLFSPLDIEDKWSNNLENLENNENLLTKDVEDVINDAEKNRNKESIHNKESFEIDNLNDSKSILIVDPFNDINNAKVDESKKSIHDQEYTEIRNLENDDNINCFERNENKEFNNSQELAKMNTLNNLNSNKNADEIFNLGSSYHIGNCVEKDEHKAFIYYLKSAEMGHIKGILNVGYCYRDGIGIEKDEHKAFTYYQKSAMLEDADRTYIVTMCYEKGVGVEKDEYKAFKYYQKSAEMGHAIGIGVEKDEHKAFIYYQKSANMKYARGVLNLGDCYLKGIGIEKDKNKAFIYYQQSAEMDEPDADGIFRVGHCYLYGIGIEKDEHKAFIHFKRSVEMSSVSGFYFLGYCYENGIGIEKDERKAFIFYQKSADMGIIMEHII
ncbi:hypothetical protein C2G38_2038178 [Gigaspora rosea]|uniref:Protein kinase domain-containing protein n=1 Tax=Gigaspora rosea TaxID=44941 RepID=A0A397V5J8_9GLOM|nr:hypothetical protein C2G38_2038178 [Gigaspora rosea]